MAAALKPATLLVFHRAMRERKYRRLFSPQRRGKPGPNVDGIALCCMFNTAIARMGVPKHLCLANSYYVHKS